jgi:hypothetical protein
MRFVVIALAIGFPIAMLLSWLYELTPEGIVRTEDLDPVHARSVQRATGRILDFIIIGVLLLVIAMLIVGRRPFYKPTGESIVRKSIAVLPFENLSANQENAFFTDGVQDEILTNLAKVAGLNVISRTSVMRYKTVGERNLPDIAKALGARGGRKCPAFRRTRARECPVNRCQIRYAALGAILRSGPRRCIRDSKRTCGTDRFPA